MNESPRPIAIFFLLLLSLIWGTSFILIKQGLKVFAPDEVGAIRVAAASFFVIPLAITRLKGVTRSDYWKLLASGLMGIFIPSFLFALAQTKLDSSVAGMLNTLTPLFTMIIGAMIFHQKFGVQAVLGILLGFGGALVLIFTRASGNIGGLNIFALPIIVACFFYASNLTFVKFKIPHIPSLTITSGSIIMIGPLALTYLFIFTEFTDKFSVNPDAWKAFGFIVLLGLMSTAVAMLIFNKLVKMSSPMFVSSATYILPIVGVMWGLLDGEKLQSGHFIGMAAILIGVYLANRKK
jgi:drug/metabolite transporter (DMT)-like permease